MTALQDKVVVITGGSAGVGRAAAEAFAREGAKVAVLARGQERLGQTVQELERLGVPALSVPVDVADAPQVENAAQQVEEQLGPIEIWVNNAMTTIFAPFKRMTPEDFRRVTEVTYLGFVYGTMAALKRMLPRDRGVIVQVGSALSDRSIPLQSAYCGAKHAIRGFTDSIRCELIHDNVWATEHIGWYRGVAAVAVITVAAAVGGALALLCQGRERGEWGDLGKIRSCRGSRR